MDFRCMRQNNKYAKEVMPYPSAIVCLCRNGERVRESERNSHDIGKPILMPSASMRVVYVCVSEATGMEGGESTVTVTDEWQCE